MFKLILGIIFIMGLIYVMLPGPTKIEDFPPIPDSLKSDEPGDTVQNPNIAAYFSQFDRKAITEYYRWAYRKQFLIGQLIPPVSLNYPPRDSWQYVKMYQKSTFLEEYVYPLHGSIFVNGHEPYVEKELSKLPHDPLGDRMQIKDKFFRSKTTIRYYPNSWYARLLVYLGIWVSALAIYKLGKRVVLS